MTRRNDDDDDDDEQRVLRDGERVRVPMWAMDSMSPVQRAVAQHSLAMQLHDGHGGAVGHRPAFVYPTDASLNDAKERAYAAYEREQAEAYKHAQGRRGRLDASGELPGTQDGQSICDAREAAYRLADEELCNAWRGPRNSGKWPIGSGQ
jgi:hypothetical protein